MRFPFDPAPRFETLMPQFCDEIRLDQCCRRLRILLSAALTAFLAAAIAAPFAPPVR